MQRSALLVRSAEIAEACGRYDDMLSLAIAAARTACNEPPVKSTARRGSWLALVPKTDTAAGAEVGVPSLRCLATLARASKLAVSTTRSPLRMLDVLDEHESDSRLKRVAGDYRREIAGKAASTRSQVQHCLESIVMPALMHLADEEDADRAEEVAASRSTAKPSTTTARAMAVSARLLGDLSRYAVEADGAASSVAGGASSSLKGAHDSIHSAAALSWYSKAQQFSHVLPAWSPLRLAVALNLSVFLFEHQGEEAEGSRVAREAAEDAATALASATDDAEDDAAGLGPGPAPEVEREGGESAISEAERLLGLLRENLSAWRRVMRVDTIVV
jgi:hypothetical protein